MGRYFRTERGYEERTHWKEETKGEVVILPEQTVIIEDDGYASLDGLSINQLIENNVYVVTLNGIKYECVCRYYDEYDCTLIGNGVIYGDGNPSNNEPFILDSYVDNEIYLNTSFKGEYTISISTIGTAYIYHKLDPNYIPTDEITVQSDWNETDGTSKAFIQNKPPIIQDENGDVYLDKLHVGLIETAKKLATEEYWYEPKKHIVLTDEINGYNYIVSMRDGNLISYCEASSISVTAMPTKTKYLDGDPFNPAGMIITARCKDGSTREVNGFTYDSTVNSANVNNFIITYKEGNNTFTTTISLSFHDFSLIDFNYIVKNDGTYELTSWKGTYNGEPSTRIVVPNSEFIIA